MANLDLIFTGELNPSCHDLRDPLKCNKIILYNNNKIAHYLAIVATRRVDDLINIVIYTQDWTNTIKCLLQKLHLRCPIFCLNTIYLTKY